MSTAQKYRKKPVEIEAMQWDGTVTEGQEIMHWAAKASGMTVPPEYLNDTPRGPVGIYTPRGLDPYLSIITLEGTMTARPGDFIIRGVQGEFYPCKPDIFEQTYEEALTPTDDEREAWLSSFEGWTPEQVKLTPYHASRVIATLLDALRRTEVPEPSVLPTFFAPKPGSTTNRLVSEPQGEPSDAQVLAALNAWNVINPGESLSDYADANVSHMRAALRAAGGVR